MATSFTLSEFEGCRTRFQRLSDARLFHGWIKEFTGARLHMTATNATSVLPGDQFAVEATGPRACARFRAVLASVGSMSRRDQQPADPSAVGQPVEVAAVLLEFRAPTQIEFFARTESNRRWLPDLPAQVKMDDRLVDCRVVDGSKAGVGLVIEEPLTPTEEILLHVETAVGGIDMRARVRYSRRIGLHNRCGLEILEMGRLDEPRWRNLLDGAA